MGPCQAWPVSGPWGPGPTGPLRVSTRYPEGRVGGLAWRRSGLAGRQTAALEWGVLYNRQDNGGPHSLGGRWTSQLWVSQPGSVVMGVAEGLDAGGSGPGEKWLRQAGTCQADPGGRRGGGREASSRHSCPHMMPMQRMGGSREAGGIPRLN